MQTLGELIKKQREKLGISQRELSRQTGVDNNTIAKLEKGMRKKTNTLALKKIAHVLDIDLKRMLKLAGYSPEDIEYECSLNTSNIIMNLEDRKSIFFEEDVDYFNDIRCAKQAILYLIDNYDFDNLEYNTDETNKNNEAVKRGLPIVREYIEKMFEIDASKVNKKEKGEKSDGDK